MWQSHPEAVAVPVIYTIVCLCPWSECGDISLLGGGVGVSLARSLSPALKRTYGVAGGICLIPELTAGPLVVAQVWLHSNPSSYF